MAVRMIPHLLVTFESLLHAAFEADEICGDMLEPSRTYVPGIFLRVTE